MNRQSFNKVFKIILINVLILIALICCLELYSYNKLKEKHSEYLKNINSKISKNDKPLKLRYGRVRSFDYDFDKKGFRPVIYGSNQKRPIVFFGCSFMYGLRLKNEQTLPYKVSKLTNRTTYNRAINGWGTQHVFYQLKREDFKKEVPDAEYIIYTVIYDHLNRFYAYNISDFSFEAMLRYKHNGSNLSEIKPVFLPCYSLYTVRNIQDIIASVKNKNINDLFFIFNQMMMKSLELSRKKYPNSKFVILIYKDANPLSEFEQNQYIENMNNLKNKGFIVIDAQDLVGHDFKDKKYLSNDNWHPSEKAWDEIAPKLVEYLKL